MILDPRGDPPAGAGTAPTPVTRPVLGWLKEPRGEERRAFDAGSSGLCSRLKGAKTIRAREEKVE